MTPSLPRPEYPRPQFVRKNWLCLNGTWDFEIDHGDSGLQRGLVEKPLQEKILVPFCPESELSGIGNVDFMEAVWYRREVEIPEEWQGNKVLLHFQACDYDTTVWVNGQIVRRHRGGWSSFSCDLEDVARPGEKAVIVVRARDPRGEPKPMGKQSVRYENFDCSYNRTTGIWQTVWMEPVPHSSLKRPRITPDVANSRFVIEQAIVNAAPGLRFKATLTDDQGEVVVAETAADLDLAARLELTIPEGRVRLWGPEDPHLYSLTLELLDGDGKVVDSAESYAGLRSVAIHGKAVKINGKTVFQRQVLDQGYYPDGILTAPSEEALVHDIKLGLEAGFNSARLHQKVFEERFLYHCDRLGYLVWGEFGDWFGGWGFGGSRVRDAHRHQPAASMITQWLEVVERDYNHPAIVGWCPLNESCQDIEDHIVTLDDVTWGMFLATKAMDLSRPVLDASGYSHRIPESDVYDSHNYEQNPPEFEKQMGSVAEKHPWVNPSPHHGRAWSIPYRGQPYWVSEFGGIWWNPDAAKDDYSWGYGDRPKSIEEFYERFEELCKILIDDPCMFGFCYTQLTDVFQEQNGIYKFDRSEKFDMDRIRKALTRPAAIEKVDD